jgi:hypothetical protein
MFIQSAAGVDGMISLEEMSFGYKPTELIFGTATYQFAVRFIDLSVLFPDGVGLVVRTGSLRVLQQRGRT